MMQSHDERRRRLLKALAALPFGLALGGCHSDSGESPKASVESLAEALDILMARLGPWPEEHDVEIVQMAIRFTESPAGAQLITDGGINLVTRVAQRMPAALGQLETLDLSMFTDLERRWLLRFIGTLYSFLEVRNRVAKEPVFGECQADPLFYTRPR